jgi:hypothetical protein
MHDWQRHATCATRPSDWWDTGDGGNRLAMMLCDRACPVRTRCRTSNPAPIGVVVAGAAFGEQGQVLRVCGCGRPIVGRSGPVKLCRQCAAVGPRIEVRATRPVLSGADELLPAARLVRTELLAAGQLAGGRRLTVAMRAHGYRLSDALGKSLSWRLRQEDAQRGVKPRVLTRNRQSRANDAEGRRAA